MAELPLSESPLHLILVAHQVKMLARASTGKGQSVVHSAVVCAECKGRRRVSQRMFLVTTTNLKEGMSPMSIEEHTMTEKVLDQLNRMDEVVVIVIKGHLLIEERMGAILEKYVFHPDFLDKARLSFNQKVQLARSISLDEHESPVWNLIIAINVLRNELAHALSSEKREAKIKAVLSVYRELTKDSMDTEKWEQHILIAFASSYCLGFLGSFEAEIIRFREAVGWLDKAINPHRHKPCPEVNIPEQTEGS